MPCKNPALTAAEKSALRKTYLGGLDALQGTKGTTILSLVKKGYFSKNGFTPKGKAAAKKISDDAHYSVTRRNPPAKGTWYILYSPTGRTYQALKEVLHGGWEWTEWISLAKTYRSMSAAKREYNRMLRSMKRPAGSVTMVAISEEARSFLL